MAETTQKPLDIPALIEFVKKLPLKPETTYMGSLATRPADLNKRRTP